MHLILCLIYRVEIQKLEAYKAELLDKIAEEVEMLLCLFPGIILYEFVLEYFISVIRFCFFIV